MVQWPYECLLILYEIDLLRVASQLWSTFRLLLRTLKDLHASPIKSIYAPLAIYWLYSQIYMAIYGYKASYNWRYSSQLYGYIARYVWLYS